MDAAIRTGFARFFLWALLVCQIQAFYIPGMFPPSLSGSFGPYLILP